MATSASTYAGSVRFRLRSGLEVLWREGVKLGSAAALWRYSGSSAPAAHRRTAQDGAGRLPDGRRTCWTSKIINVSRALDGWTAFYPPEAVLPASTLDVRCSSGQ